MHFHRRPDWRISENRVTPENFVLRRRSLLVGAAAVAGTLSTLKGWAAGSPPPAPPVAAGLPSEAAPRNPAYQPGRPLTAETDATTYNNYYEFSTGKTLYRAAQALRMQPWTIQIDGLVTQKRTLGLEELLRQVTLEERVYRHRCVEAWAMTVPWTGFPLSALVKLAQPLGSARYVQFETAVQRDTMPGLASPFFTWPYVEAVTIEEAANDLAFIATGLYGKPLPPQNGGPIRLTLPWKYGFKSAKSLVKISFVEKRPDTFWAALGPDEYGFWANVNPAVPHPRWSQATERLLGSDERVPTQIYNGYAPQVAALYADKKGEKLFM
jgi:sulfoxide reductase catalytic subunit YedY